MEVSCTSAIYLHAMGVDPMPSTRKLHGFNSAPMDLARREVIKETSAPSSNKRDAVLEPLAELTSTTAARSRDLVGVGGSPKQAWFTLATAGGVEAGAGAEGSQRWLELECRRV